jgi:hypothetical protein
MYLSPNFTSATHFFIRVLTQVAGSTSSSASSINKFAKFPKNRYQRCQKQQRISHHSSCLNKAHPKKTHILFQLFPSFHGNANLQHCCVLYLPNRLLHAAAAISDNERKSVKRFNLSTFFLLPTLSRHESGGWLRAASFVLSELSGQELTAATFEFDGTEDLHQLLWKGVKQDADIHLWITAARRGRAIFPDKHIDFEKGLASDTICPMRVNHNAMASSIRSVARVSLLNHIHRLLPTIAIDCAIQSADPNSRTEIELNCSKATRCQLQVCDIIKCTHTGANFINLLMK